AGLAACEGRRFFFSSRGRHTRFSRDWSSDVCASDLSDHVDVLATFRDPGSQEMVTVTLLHNVVVLATGRASDRDSSWGRGYSEESGRAACRERVQNTVSHGEHQGKSLCAKRYLDRKQ